MADKLVSGNNRVEVLYKCINKETLWREEDTLVLEFLNERKVSSTSALNGGITDGIRAIFNQTTPIVDTEQKLPGGSIEAYLAHMASLRGLDPKSSGGLLTAASQQNVAFTCLSFRELRVLAVATAGVDINGGQAGDPASYYEEKGQFYLFSGTINILLSINACLPPAALLKAIITATEAKSAILLELLAPSCYSVEIATGSGTDGIIIASDPSSTITLTDSGHHSKLGELISRSVKKVIREALAMETGYTPKRQMDIFARLKRFGIDERLARDYFQSKYPNYLGQEEYQTIMAGLAREPELVALTSCLLHLADQVRWGLLPKKAAIKTAKGILTTGGMETMLNFEPNKNEDLIELLLGSFNELVWNFNGGKK